MEPHIQYAKTEDGVSIAYYIIGDGAPLLRMTVGALSHIQLEWQAVQNRDFHLALSEGRSLVRYDGRDSGLSGEDDEPLTLDKCLLDLGAVVDALQLERFSLLASLGSGPPAIAYAARNPERVSSLILWCTSARKVDVYTSPGDRALGALRKADWKRYTEVVAFYQYGWDSGDAGREFAKRIRETMTPEKFQRILSESYRFDASTELGNVKARTLVMQRKSTGRMGHESMEASRTLASEIPNAELLILEGEVGTIVAGDTAATIAAINQFLGVGRTASNSADTHTILFTDMASSTTLADQFGDAKAQEVRRVHNQIVRSALGEHSGNEIKHTGDGIMASFATASSALDAAIAIQRGVAAHKEEQPDSPLAVYVGLNAGEPIAEDDDLFGTSINLAARICDHATAGQILAANVVRELAAGKDFLFSDLGETELRGFEDPVKLWELRWQDEG